jgi:hypothetical protein
VCFRYKKVSLLASKNGRNGKQQIFLYIYFPRKAKKLSKENQDTEKEQQHVVFIRRQQGSTRKSHTERPRSPSRFWPIPWAHELLEVIPSQTLFMFFEDQKSCLRLVKRRNDKMRERERECRRH